MSRPEDRRTTLYGLVHVPPLPGTPFNRGVPLPEIVAGVMRSVRALRDGGMDGVLLQTSDRVHPAGDEANAPRVAAMAILTSDVVRSVPADFHVGVQIMRNALTASLSVAKLAGARFVRATALVGVTASSQGWVVPDSLAAMELRERLDAWDVELLADVDTVHYSWYGSSLSVDTVARRALTAGADAVCIGHPDTDLTRRLLVRMRQSAPEVPVVLAGHCTDENASVLLPLVDRAFVSRSLTGGDWHGDMGVERVQRFVEQARAARG